MYVRRTKAGIWCGLFSSVFIWASQKQTLRLGWECKEMIWEVIQGNVGKGVEKEDNKKWGFKSVSTMGNWCVIPPETFVSLQEMHTSEISHPGDKGCPSTYPCRSLLEEIWEMGKESFDFPALVGHLRCRQNSSSHRQSPHLGQRNQVAVNGSEVGTEHTEIVASTE